MTIGACGMYMVAVVLPAVQAEFGVARADASLPYSMMMIGYGLGGVVMGRLADRYGVMVPLLIGACGLGLGLAAAGAAPNIWTFALAHGALIGFVGCSATMAPLIADTSLWFFRRRGIAVAICASGNYLAGALWPPVLQHFFEVVGAHQTCRVRVQDTQTTDSRPARGTAHHERVQALDRRLDGRFPPGREQLADPRERAPVADPDPDGEAVGREGDPRRPPEAVELLHSGRGLGKAR